MQNKFKKIRSDWFARFALLGQLSQWQSALPSKIARTFLLRVVQFVEQQKNHWLFTTQRRFRIHLITKKVLYRFSSYLLLTLLVVTQADRAIAHQVHGSDYSGAIGQTAERYEPVNLLEEGRNYYHAGQFTEALKSWNDALISYQAERQFLSEIQTLNYLALAYKELGQIQAAQEAIATNLNRLSRFKKLDYTQGVLLAQALNTQGTLQLLQGQTEIALTTWEEASATYKLFGDKIGHIISTINQAQALQVLGQNRRAKLLLEQRLNELSNEPDSLLKAQALRSLGVALQNLGQLRQSKTILEQSWELSKQLNSPEDISAALFRIGNVARELQQYPVAWTYYEKALNLSSNPLNQVEIQLNQLRVLIDAERWQPALGMIPTIETNLKQLVPSRPAIYLRINLAENLLKLQKNSKSHQVNLTFNNKQIAEIIAVGIQQARAINDARSQAYALYQLGSVYKEEGRYSDAETLTKESLKIAQQMNALDINARAGAQLGGILTQQGESLKAISAYQIAFNNLQSLRSDLVATNTDIQFDFKTSIEPLYREFVSLLLQQNDSQANIRQAREVMEALQLAELDNFFQDTCLDTYPVAIEEIDTTAATIYPIILPDRLEVILSIPNQPLHHYSTDISQDNVENHLKQFYSALSPGYPRDEQLKIAQELYNWLIQPAEGLLNQHEIQTLVFIPDGFLRNLPMAALYDGQQYLIEKYRVSISPGLQLFPQGFKQKENLTALAVGITEARQGFNSLPGVTEEMAQVTSNVNSKVLLDREFTLNSFKTAINSQSFPIVHLATHGQFSSNPEETFLLTWSDRISMEDFDQLFQKRRVGILEPIELLVMSACQTAAGDNRATLGLAGFALRSGAKSTLGSLWSVSDESTSYLMGEFYAQLTNAQSSKAEALRQAQLKLLNSSSFKHPYFWASFVLVGNWL